jgi:hypothetical protein
MCLARLRSLATAVPDFDFGSPAGASALIRKPGKKERSLILFLPLPVPWFLFMSIKFFD